MQTSYVGDRIDPRAVEEHAQVRRQLERVLAHSSFKNSRRYQAFLRYVVEETLKGNGEHLKERTIGVAVFNQPLSYDTNANSVVRVTAGEIRRRLAQYYLDASLSDEILIELPLGSYVPEFRFHDAVPLPEIILVDLDHHLPSIAEEPVRQQITIAPEPAPAQKPPLWKRGYIVALAAACLLAAVIAIVFVTREATLTEADRLWKGAFGHENVVLCTGSLDSQIRLGEDVKLPPPPNGFSFTSARTAVIIASAIGHAGGTALLLPEKDTKFEELQRSPVVLIGAFNNEWTLKLQAPLRYQFYRSPDGTISGITDTKNPDSKQFTTGRNAPGPHTRDYGIVAHFRSPTTGQSTFIAAGLAMHGTAAVRLFLSTPELLEEFSRKAPSGWEKRNYEIVLASDQVNNLADPPKVAEAYFW